MGKGKQQKQSSVVEKRLAKALLSQSVLLL
jgi:hypothetical protein